MPVPRIRRSLPLIAALVITLYGAVLRVDALVAKYGTLDHPAWARFVTHAVAPAGTAIRPFALGWPPIDHPYVGGDPINYLKYAREMRWFYQAHVREPVFLALTRGWLWLLSNQDIAVSFASLTGSVLTILATYLLGAALAGPAAGLLAASVMAIEWEMITWAPDGWRDDTFTATVIFTAWALVRFNDRRSLRNAILVGVTGAAACLTRITAVSFILPALVWIFVAGPAAARREMLRPLAVAVVTLGALVAPYLINCATELGDPLYAINYHTVYYRHGEGLPAEQPMSASTYLREKAAVAPLATLDTAMVGILVQPFETKWSGLGATARWLRPVLYWSAAAGLLMLMLTPAGRLFLVILFTSLVPYAFTWNIAGGGEWRFTMHAYPFYVVAACYALVRTARAGYRAWREPATFSRETVLAGASRTATLAAIASVACAVYLAMPWFVGRETLARGQDLMVGPGARDLTFFRRDWSPPQTEGIATVRVSLTERAVVWLPIPSVRAYEVVLRFDPVSPELQHRVSVLLNRQFIATVGLGYDAQRVGSYRIGLPKEHVRAGANELMLIPDVIVPRAAAGPRFAWVPAGDRLGVRLWYVRLLAN
jgi:hypothetical protein